MLWSLLLEQTVTSEKQIVEIQLNRNLRSEIKVACLLYTSDAADEE